MSINLLVFFFHSNLGLSGHRFFDPLPIEKWILFSFPLNLCTIYVQYRIWQKWHRTSLWVKPLKDQLLLHRKHSCSLKSPWKQPSSPAEKIPFERTRSPTMFMLQTLLVKALSMWRKLAWTFQTNSSWIPKWLRISCGAKELPSWALPEFMTTANYEI